MIRGLVLQVRRLTETSGILLNFSECPEFRIAVHSDRQRKIIILSAVSVTNMSH